MVSIAFRWPLLTPTILTDSVLEQWYVSSCLSKSIVAGCRNNVSNRLILHSKALEQVLHFLVYYIINVYSHTNCYIRCVVRTV